MSRWTDAFIKALPAPDKSAKRYFEHAADDSLKGFGVQVTPAGTRGFFVRFTSPQDGKRRSMSLGTYPTISLAKARQRCREARTLLGEGIDPQADREGREAARKAKNAREAQKGTVADLFALYIEHLESDKRRSSEQVASIYKRDIEPTLGTMKACNVSADDIADVLARIMQRAGVCSTGGATLANRTRSYIRSAFEFGKRVQRMPEYRHRAPEFAIVENPAEGTAKAAKSEAPRDRYLSADELRTLWQTLGNARPVVAIVRGKEQRRETRLDALTMLAVRWMIATGQRVEEVLGARWDEIDREHGVWGIPAERRKNRRHNHTREPHLVPLVPTHLDLLDDIAALRVDDTPWLFASTRRPLGAARGTDSLSQAVRRWCDATGFERFQPRDLRRTFKTLAGRAGVDLEIRNRLQGHAMPDIGSRHYDRYDYLDEKRAGMERWCGWLERVLADKPADVLSLEARRRAG